MMIKARGRHIISLMLMIASASILIQQLAAQTSDTLPTKSNPTATTITTTTSSTTSTSAPSVTQNPTTNKPQISSETMPPVAPISSTSADSQTITTMTTLPPATQNIDEVKKIVRQHIEQNSRENRLVLNKPTSAPPMVDFAPESIEARVADATTDFGLRFINNLPNQSDNNVVISPMSLQNLLNMILLGAGDNSTTQQELAQVLGYKTTELLSGNSSSQQQDRLRPHEAMRNVFQSIMAATHLTVSPPLSQDEQAGDLLNTNSASLKQEEESNSSTAKVAAHLQTITKEGDTPLDGQLNFTLANLVLTNKDRVELKPDYENDLKTYYNVNVEQFSRDISTMANISTDKSGSALHERVNKWVKNMTQNQIEKLAEEADLDGDDLIMVLLNAAHFKGRWLHTFNSKATYDRTFFNNGLEKDAATVKFMRQKSVLGYADFSTNSLLGGDYASEGGKTRSIEEAETLLTEDAQSGNSSSPAKNGSQPVRGSDTMPAIELSKEEMRRLELTSKLNCSVLMLPFSLNDGQELSMIILLPAKRDGIAELQASLSGAALNEIYRSFSEQQVQVELPKFAFEASHDAKATLLKMGLKSIFQETAHLERMFKLNSKSNQQNPAKVDKVIHKAKISVDESGAEAAAASMASVVLRNFIRPPTPIFIADHPFLFVIRHNRSNMPLFMGRVSSL